MGQYWLVACPKERQYSQAWKLAETLFSSWPESLIPYLINPQLCSKWKTNTSLSNVSHITVQNDRRNDRHSRRHLGKRSSNGPIRQKATSTPLSQQGGIRKSYAGRGGRGRQRTSSASGSTNREEGSTRLNSVTESGSQLLGLPHRLQVLILDQLNAEDVRAFALTCQQFLALVSGFGRWANKHIICVGDYLEKGNLPSIADQEGGKTLDNDDPEFGSMRPYGLAQNEYDYLTDRFWRCHWQNKYGRHAILPAGRILRNLTTKQFVREDALTSGIGLGHIVLMRICWSSDPSTSITGGGYLTEGQWAGHRFDIVSEEMVIEEMVAEARWVDVTSKVLDEVDELWSGEFRDDWRETWNL
jgi:hypothetical protein